MRHLYIFHYIYVCIHICNGINTHTYEVRNMNNSLIHNWLILFQNALLQSNCLKYIIICSKLDSYVLVSLILRGSYCIMPVKRLDISFLWRYTIVYQPKIVSIFDTLNDVSNVIYFKYLEKRTTVPFQMLIFTLELKPMQSDPSSDINRVSNFF